MSHADLLSPAIFHFLSLFVLPAWAPSPLFQAQGLSAEVACDCSKAEKYPGLAQLISDPRHQTGQSLDLVFCPDQSNGDLKMGHVIIIPLSRSDHYPVSFRPTVPLHRGEGY